MPSSRTYFLIALLTLTLSAPLGDAQSAAPAPPRNISDITALLDQYRPDPEKVGTLKAVLSRKPPVDSGNNELYRFYRERANAAQELGVVRQQVADLKQALELIPNVDPRYLSLKQDLFHAEMDAGNFFNALKVKEDMLKEDRGRRGRNYSDYLNLAGLYVRMSNMEEARAAVRDAEALLIKLQRSRKRADREAGYLAKLEDVRGQMFEAEGKLEQAERSYRKRLAEREEFLETADREIAGRRGEPPRERFERARDGAERSLAGVLIKQGSLFEAEVAARNVLTRGLGRQGRYAPGTASNIRLLAGVLNEQGRYREAEAMAQAAIEIYEKISAAPESFRVIATRRTLGEALVMQRRWQDALAAYEEMRSSIAGDPRTLEQFGRGDVNWALALIKTGQAAAAVPVLEQLARQSRARFGSDHYQYGEQRGFLAMALLETGQRQEARSGFEEAVKVLLAHGRADASEEDRSPARTSRLVLILEAYIRLLYDLRNKPQPGLDAASEAFRVADAVRGRSTQKALAASAARASANDPALADFVRREQDAQQQIAVLYTTLLRLLDAPADQQLPQVVAQMRARIQELEKERRALFVQLERRFPAYANLINPRPATVEETRGALREGEALVSVLATEDRTFVWMVPKQGTVGFHASSLGEVALNRRVSQLRRALDAGDVPLERLPEFDVAMGHRLYAELLAPLAGAWRGAHTLMVVANGGLGQLPFALLVTAPAVVAKDGPRFSGYRDVPWLIKQAAVTQLPAVSSLVTLRALPQTSAARSAFIGFGDPQFGSSGLVAKAQPVALRMRDAALPRLETSKAAEWTPYSRLAPLPDTREEILSIAQALKADPQKDVFLGPQASKRNVKAADLSTRRIVAFATHGLIPGDFPNLEEPALALSAADGNAETGLLTLGDILELKMNADWVVLSACNTAAGDGSGAEAISGLGRGFFYAGSRALLVTHWPVETTSARMLVTSLFERYAGSPGLSRAEALRQASLAVMQSTAQDSGGKPLFSYAHPLFWAPYALVGDGGR